MKRMQNKVALVTGAALGYKNGGPSIGSAIAFKLASEGAKVVIVDINEEMGKRAAERIRQESGEAVFIECDVSKTEDVKRAIETTKKEFGELHCIVNCAASYKGDIFKNVVETSEKDWKHIIDINLNGYYRFAKYGIPLILESGGGTVVNISSAAAFKVNKNFSVYPVTKSAINSLTRTIAIDFAPEIRCNAICPGFVRIANSENDRTGEELKEWLEGIAKTYPLKRVCSVEEIANVALFLASEESSYINGECIVVDGGRSVADSHEF